MSPHIIRTLLTRELGALRREIELYPTDDSLWALPPGLSNSAGTLVLHLAGNLQHYIGVRLGGTEYVRDRPLEFSERGASRERLLELIDASAAAVARGLETPPTSALLAGQYPEPVAGRIFATGDFLLHLVAHLGYHLGQIDYHRRIVTGDNRTADALSVLEIPEHASFQ